MKPTEQFWRLVDEHLDARRDPLDDASVRIYLDEHPELLEEFATLTAAMRALSTPMSAKSRRSYRIARATAAALLLVAVGLSLWHAWREPSEPDIVLPDIADGGRVLRHASRSYTLGPDGEFTSEFETGAVSEIERHVLTRVEPRATTPHGHVIRTVLTSQRSRLRADITDTP